MFSTSVSVLSLTIDRGLIESNINASNFTDLCCVTCKRTADIASLVAIFVLTASDHVKTCVKGANTRAKSWNNKRARIGSISRLYNVAQELLKLTIDVKMVTKKRKKK